eukprot:6212451-Pleurochrysis_carterae.AAC.6
MSSALSWIPLALALRTRAAGDARHSSPAPHLPQPYQPVPGLPPPQQPVGKGKGRGIGGRDRGWGEAPAQLCHYSCG